MKLLIMGAGYVGMALLKQLQNSQHEIYITTTQEERVDTLRSLGKDVLLLPGNLEKWIEKCDAMIILVAPKHSQSAFEYSRTYLDTAKQISSLLKDRSTPFYLLYTSSTSVCEGAESEWVTEEMSLHPHSENAKILLETENVYLQSNASTCILRLGGIYGPGRELTERARRLSGKKLTGTGDEPTNNIHLNDILAAIAFCLERSLTGIYHVVNDDHPTRKELYSSLCRSLNLPLPTWDPALSPLKRRGYQVSNEKIKKIGFPITFSRLP